MRSPRAVLAALLAALVLPSCALVDAPFLGLRSIAGGIHNTRHASGIRPFFLPDGRLGVAANGALVVERTPGGELVPLADEMSEIDDPDASSDGSAVVFTAGRELVSAGGAHNDHVFQLYALELASGEWRRLSRSRRAESLPRWTADASEVVFVRRAEYDGWSRHDPWGPGSIFVAEADGSNERRLTEGLFHPFYGLALVAHDSLLVFGARASAGGERRALYALDYPSGGTPRVLLADAYLPARVPGTDELVVARRGARGDGLARIDLAGHVQREFDLGLREVLGLAVSPDGKRVVYSDLDPDGANFGEYRLWSLALDGHEPELVSKLPYRPIERFKPLDVVKPPSWWFRPSSSPGSR